MRTLQYNNTFTSAITNQVGGVNAPVMEIKVQNNNSTAIHCVTDNAGMVIKTAYVFTDPGTGAIAQEVDYDSITMVAGVMQVLNYQYKVDHIRVYVASSGTSGTVRITANVTQS
jgi:hypothetical protein